MEFRRLEYFIVLAEKLNFSEAADILCISPPALSKQITALEKEMGGPLLNRTTRHVQLTEIGQECYTRFKNIKDQYDRAFDDIRLMFRKKKDIIRIAFFSVLPKYQLVNPVLNYLSTLFPSSRIEMSSGEMDEIHRWLVEDKIDICITATNDNEDWSGCKIVKLFSKPAKVAVSLYHPWNIKETITEEDLGDGSIVLLRETHYLNSDSFYRKIRCRNRVDVEDFHSLLTTLELGREFSVFPQYFNEISFAKLKYFDLPESLRFTCHWVFAYKDNDENRTLDHVLSRLTEELKIEV